MINLFSQKKKRIKSIDNSVNEKISISPVAQDGSKR